MWEEEKWPGIQVQDSSDRVLGHVGGRKVALYPSARQF